jgi:hypothetical protein
MTSDEEAEMLMRWRMVGTVMWITTIILAFMLGRANTQRHDEYQINCRIHCLICGLRSDDHDCQVYAANQLKEMLVNSSAKRVLVQFHEETSHFAEQASDAIDKDLSHPLCEVLFELSSPKKTEFDIREAIKGLLD